MMTMKLDLGCGRLVKEGFVGCDKFPTSEEILKIDMDEKLPFKDNSIEEVYMDNSLEHVRNYDFTLMEIHRILKSGGKITIRVPHWSHYSAFMPDHKTLYGFASLEQYFNTKNPNTSMAWSVKVHFRLVKRKLILPAEPPLPKSYTTTISKLLSPLYNRWPQLAELFWCKIYPIQEVYFELEKEIGLPSGSPSSGSSPTYRSPPEDTSRCLGTLSSPQEQGRRAESGSPKHEIAFES